MASVCPKPRCVAFWHHSSRTVCETSFARATSAHTGPVLLICTHRLLMHHFAAHHFKVATCEYPDPLTLHFLPFSLRSVIPSTRHFVRRAISVDAYYTVLGALASARSAHLRKPGWCGYPRRPCLRMHHRTRLEAGVFPVAVPICRGTNLSRYQYAALGTPPPGSALKAAPPMRMAPLVVSRSFSTAC